MENETYEVCRLCLKKLYTTDSFDVLQDFMKDVVDVLLLNLNLSMYQQPVACKSCVENIMMCFNFKCTCLYTEDYITPFTSYGIPYKKVDLKVVHRQVKASKNNLQLTKDQMICRLCFSMVENNEIAVLYSVLEDGVLDVLKTHFPEMNINITTEPRICWICVETLKFCGKFMKKCLNTEKKIKIFCDEDPEKPSENQVILSDTLENNLSFTPFKCKLCPYECKRKCDFKTHTLQHLHHSGVTLHKCSLCPFTSKYKHSLIKHALVHKDRSEVKIFKCHLCRYETKHKGCFTRHSLVHKDPSEVTTFLCKVCGFETKHKDVLKTHLRRHQDEPEEADYKCQLCSHVARNEWYLKRHLLKHKDPKEIAKYKCDDCPFNTMYKARLQRHKLTHTTQRKSYECQLCPYKTHIRIHLERHLRSSRVHTKYM